MRLCAATLTVLATTACAAGGVEPYVELNAPLVALTSVRVIDGTGRPGSDGQTVLIQDGRIAAVGPADTVDVPAGARALDLPGRTVIPGLVGMHEYLFYQIQRPSSPPMMFLAQAAFAKLYLAAGVTTIRTAGTADFAGDLRLKRRIDSGQEPGPTIHVTGPYLNAVGADPSPEAIARQVADAADEGATSFKAYTALRSAELKAAIEAAHARGLRVTGHLCAVGFREAAALGIDNVEHGLVMNSDLYSRKQPDQCPAQNDVLGALMSMNENDVRIQRTIADLVRHGVAVTSTLAVLESYTGRDRVLDPQVPVLLAARLRESYHAAREPYSTRGATVRAPGRGSCGRRCSSSARSSPRVGGCWRASIPPVGAAWWRARATIASSSCSWKPA
jgi:imidazolonepropionase-like amidohydrolase